MIELIPIVNSYAFSVFDGHDFGDNLVDGGVHRDHGVRRVSVPKAHTLELHFAFDGNTESINK